MASFQEEDHNNKIAAFYKKVADIEKKHIGIFKDQLSKLTAQYPYILENYFFIQWDTGKYELIFTTEIYIPQHIREDLLAAFSEIVLEKRTIY